MSGIYSATAGQRERVLLGVSLLIFLLGGIAIGFAGAAVIMGHGSRQAPTVKAPAVAPGDWGGARVTLSTGEQAHGFKVSGATDTVFVFTFPEGNNCLVRLQPAPGDRTAAAAMACTWLKAAP